MTISQDNANSAAPAPERFVGQLPGYQIGPGQANAADTAAAAPTPGAGRWAETIADPDVARPLGAPSSVALSLDDLNEPVFPPAAWLEETGLADHPLLRGLLMELPPKGSAPSPEWLNRWFEAARAILELLYMR
ncbi:MAG: hypothetical protein HOV79_00160 [Hamadaea sp.]|nr:hypothetical protein [Hamadaea sp.]